MKHLQLSALLALADASPTNRHLVRCYFAILSNQGLIRPLSFELLRLYADDYWQAKLNPEILKGELQLDLLSGKTIPIYDLLLMHLQLRDKTTRQAQQFSVHFFTAWFVNALPVVRFAVTERIHNAPMLRKLLIDLSAEHECFAIMVGAFLHNFVRGNYEDTAFADDIIHARMKAFTQIKDYQLKLLHLANTKHYYQLTDKALLELKEVKEFLAENKVVLNPGDVLFHALIRHHYSTEDILYFSLIEDGVNHATYLNRAFRGKYIAQKLMMRITLNICVGAQVNYRKKLSRNCTIDLPLNTLLNKNNLSAQDMVTVIDFLVLAGANLQLHTTIFGEASHAAAMYSHPDVLAHIIRQGANPYSNRCLEGKTPLMSAAQEGKIENISVLTKVGAPVNAKSSLGKTALLFSMNEQTVRALLDAGASPDVTEINGMNAPQYFAIEKKPGLALAISYYDKCKETRERFTRQIERLSKAPGVTSSTVVRCAIQILLEYRKMNYRNIFSKLSRTPAPEVVLGDILEKIGFDPLDLKRFNQIKEESLKLVGRYLDGTYVDRDMLIVEEVLNLCAEYLQSVEAAEKLKATPAHKMS